MIPYGKANEISRNTCQVGPNGLFMNSIKGTNLFVKIN